MGKWRNNYLCGQYLKQSGDKEGAGPSLVYIEPLCELEKALLAEDTLWPSARKL